MRGLLAISISFLFLLVGCNTFTARNIKELEYPGFVDVGAGYAVAYNTRDGDNNDADGFLLSLRAYPFGRWYSKPKSTTAAALNDASAVLVENEVTETPARDRPIIQTAKDEVDRARTNIAVPATVAVHIDLAEKELLKLREEEWRKEVLGFLDEAKSPPAGADSLFVSNRLNDASKTLDRRLAALDEVDDEIEELIARLSSAQRELLNEEFYEVAVDGESSGERFWRRFSVFYGTSLNEFSGGGLESTVNAVGLAFDVAPQLSIMGGVAYYDVDDGTGNVDTDNGLILAVSLNLNAFRWMFGDMLD